MIAIKDFVRQVNIQLKKSFWIHNDQNDSFYIHINIKCDLQLYAIDIQSQNYICTIFAKISMNKPKAVPKPIVMKYYRGGGLQSNQ